MGELTALPRPPDWISGRGRGGRRKKKERVRGK